MLQRNGFKISFYSPDDANLTLSRRDAIRAFTEAIDPFTDKPYATTFTTFLLGSLGTVAEGHNLQSARLSWSAAPSNSFGKIAQFERRSHRLGQRKTTKHGIVALTGKFNPIPENIVSADWAKHGGSLLENLLVQRSHEGRATEQSLMLGDSSGAAVPVAARPSAAPRKGLTSQTQPTRDRDWFFPEEEPMYKALAEAGFWDKFLPKPFEPSKMTEKDVKQFVREHGLENCRPRKV